MYINERKACLNIELACDVLKISPSCYYAWVKNQAQNVAKLNYEKSLEQQIMNAFASSRSTYGASRIYDSLQKQNVAVSLKKIRRKMSNLGLRPVGLKKYKATTNSKHKYPVFANLLQRNFDLDAPNKAWVSDITYLWTDEGWYYLATVIDLFSRQVVGFKLGSRMTKELVINALNDAWIKRGNPTGVIVHTDRGSQYASNEYKATLARNGLIGSMSRKGDCWDNAVAESFFATLKKEYVYQTKFKSRIQVHLGVFDYIEAWYNNKRIHTKLGGLSPKEFEAEYNKKIKIAKTSQQESQANMVQ